MSHQFPVDDVAGALVARILTRRSGLAPVPKVVAFNQYWMEGLPNTPAEIAARLSAVYVEMGEDASFRSDHAECAIEQGYPFSLNFIYPLQATPPVLPLPVGRALAEMFSVGDQLDEIPEIDTAIGSYLDSVEITGMGFDRSLAHLNIGWFQVRIVVNILSQ